MSTLHSLRTNLRRGEHVCTFSRVRTQLSRKTRLPQHGGENWLSRPLPNAHGIGRFKMLLGIVFQRAHN